MRVDRTKLAPVANNSMERYVEDDEYAEVLVTKLRMLGAVTLDRHPYTQTVGYVPDKSKWHKGLNGATGSDPMNERNWRFLMGKRSERGKWQIHPSRVNWFLNGGWNAGQNKT